MTDFESPYINPLTDPGFKRLFGREQSKDVLIGFLNALFEHESTDPIVELSFMDKERVKEFEDGRTIIYDILCTTSCGKRFIVEMQNYDEPQFVDRTIFYMSRGITDQASSGEWRYQYMPVYGVFISSTALRNVPKKLRTDVMLCDIATGQPFSDRLRSIFIQLNYFTKQPSECVDNFDKWLYTIKNMKDLQELPFMADVFRRVEEISRKEHMSRDERIAYERDLKAYRDYNWRLSNAEERGLEKGEVKGIVKTARNLLDLGMGWDFIYKATGLTEADYARNAQGL